jgi:hypothetical protein
MVEYDEIPYSMNFESLFLVPYGAYDQEFENSAQVKAGSSKRVNQIR